MHKSLAAIVVVFGVATGVMAQAMAAEFKGLTTASPLFGDPSIGNTEVVVKTVTGSRDDKLRKLAYKDDIYHNELIQTYDESATEIVFLDDTTLSLGPNSEITLDRFVYDPDQNAGSFAMTVTQGALRFASGKLSSDSYKIHTPVATIGIRGTLIEINVHNLVSDSGAPLTKVDLNVIKGEAVLSSCTGDMQHILAGHAGHVLASAAQC